MKIALALCLIGAPAFAQEPVNPCAPDHAAIVARLAEKYGESRASAGLDRRDLIVEMYGNPETGTWTLLSMAPDGETCIEASGVGFMAFPMGAPT